MTGHAILYLGRGEYAPGYLAELESLPCCTMLLRWQQLEARDDLPPAVDLILIEAGASPVRAGLRLVDFLKSLPDRPVVALCDRANEHQGIAAVRAGADAYICIDDVSVEEQDAILDYVVRRFRLTRRLSETDVTVLSILRNINDSSTVSSGRC